MVEDKKQQQKRRNRRRGQQQKKRNSAPVAPKQRRAIPAQVRKLVSNSAIQGSTLARQMAIPDVPQGHLLRMPTVDMPSVGVLSTQDTFSVTHTPLGASAGKLPVKTDGTVLYIMYGQPGRSLVYGPVPSSLGIDNGTVKFEYGAGDASTVVYGAMALTTSTPTYGGGSCITGQWRPTMTKNIGTPDEEFRGIGMSMGKPFVFVNGTEKICYWTFNEAVNGAFASPLVVTIYKWVGPNDLPATAAVLAYVANDPAMAAFSWTPTTSGYYTFEWSLGVIDNASIHSNLSLNVELQTAIASPCFMVHKNPRVIRNQDIGEYVRRTGFSILVTNTSSAISKQGNIIAARMVAEGPANGLIIGKENESAVSSLANKYSGAAEKGVYSYMDFDTGAERFGQSFNEDGCPTFNLDYNGFVHTILVSNPAVASIPNNYLVTVYGIYEFFTDNPIYTAMPSPFDHNALCEARRVNNSTAYFYENPLHISDIWKFIKESFGLVRRAAVPLGMAASAMFPESTPFVMPMAHMLQT